MSHPGISRDDVTKLKELSGQLSSVRFADRARLARELDRLFTRRSRGADFDASVASLQSALSIFGR